MLFGLLSAAFTTSVSLEPNLRAGAKAQTSEASGLLETLMGDSRRLFAQHFYLKADAYFHSGYYPSIFDRPAGAPRTEDVHLKEESTRSSDAEVHHENDGHDHSKDLDHKSDAKKPGTEEKGHDHEHEDAHDHADEDELKFLGESKDWIERFGRHFFPSTHAHLETRAEQNEILPWLKLSAELDPNKVEVYTVSAYWLRTRLGKVDEAEEFLRLGWRLNPDSHQILHELGKLFAEGRKDPIRALNVLELALGKWRSIEPTKKEPDLFGLQQILTALVRLDEQAGRWSEGARRLQLLKEVAADPAKVEALRLEFEQKAKTGVGTPNESGR